MRIVNIIYGARNMQYFYIFPFFLMFYEFVVNMSNDMYTPAFPLITNYFSVHSDMTQLTLSSWLVGDAISQLVLGPLSDRFGRRAVLMAGGGVFIISCLGCATTTSMYLFIFYRFIQGIGVCSMMIAGYSCIHETYKDRDAINILALMSGVSVTAPMIGPFAGGYLIMQHPWQVIFWAIGFLALFAILCLYFVMPKGNQAQVVKLNLKDTCANYHALIKNNKFMVHAMIFGLFYSGLMLWISTSPFILMVENDLTSPDFGVVQIPVFASFIVGSQLVRFIIDKVPLEKIIEFGIGGAVISSVVLLLNHTVVGIVISTMIYALSFGLISAPLNRISFNASDSSKGITASVFYTCMMTTGAIITMIFGFIYTDVTSYAWAMAAVIGVAVVLYGRFR